MTIGYELTDVTKAGLLDETLTLTISHPLETLARETVAAMIRARSASESGANQTVLLPFDIHTPENL